MTLSELAEQLRDLPHLIRDGTTPERRAVLGEVFDQLYAERDRIAAIRPTGLYEPLILAARDNLTARRKVSATLHKLR